MKRRRLFWRRMAANVSAFIGGTLFALVLLEVILAVTGLFFHQKSSAFAPVDSTKKHILCIGDSFTQGMGSTHGFEYPAHLQNILDSVMPGKYQVHNAGQSSRNTAMMLDYLNDALRSFRPDVVILLGGGANYWNYTGYSRNTIFEQLLWRSRIFKLFRLLADKVREKKDVRDARIPFSKERYDELRQQYTELPQDSTFDAAVIRRLDNRYPRLCASYRESFDTYHLKRKKDYHNYEGNAYVHILREEYEAAGNLLRQALRQYPDEGIYYLLLSVAEEESGDIQEAIQVCRAWLLSGTEREWALHRTGAVYYRAGNKDSSAFYFRQLSLSQNPKASALWEEGAASKPDSTVFRDIYDLIPLYDWVERLVYMDETLLMKGIPETDSWICNDLGKIVRVCNKRKIPVLLLNYPVNTYDKRSFIAIQANRAIRECGISGNSMKIDVASAFNRTEGIRDSYFAADGHCNNKGYRLMAETVFEIGLRPLLSE